jgi:hypothetical protein
MTAVPVRQTARTKKKCLSAIKTPEEKGNHRYRFGKQAENGTLLVGRKLERLDPLTQKDAHETHAAGKVDLRRIVRSYFGLESRFVTLVNAVDFPSLFSVAFSGASGVMGTTVGRNNGWSGC